MRAANSHPRRRLLEYDSLQRRLWIAGQRCHHGATGAVVATVSCLGLLAGQVKPAPEQVKPAPTPLKPLLALALAGGALMAHDWKDHSLWFMPGPQPD
jgi:hypothetical protein